MTGLRLINTSLFFLSKPLLSSSQLSAGPSSLFMEMDFYVMKRKKLQQLCKKHGIPANLGNIEMANSLTFLLKVQIQKVKKVRFNPENEILFFVATPNYSYSGPKKKRVQKRKSRVKQAPKKKQVQLAENAKELKLSDTPVRLTRSSAHKMQEGNAEAVCLPCSVRKKVRSGEKNVGGCNKLPLEVTLSEGVGGETVSSGGIIHRQLRSRMAVRKYGGDSMVSREKTNEDSVVASIGVEPEKLQEQFKVNVTKVEGSSVLSEKMGEIDSGGRITRSRTRAEGIAYCWIR